MKPGPDKIRKGEEATVEDAACDCCHEEQVQKSDNQNATGDLTPTTKERTTCIWMAKKLMALSQKELHMQHQLLMAQ
ncbi:unnamed protein product [Pieris brassicae]|uniref:Uncharacterized protein n=1 Tax=Pieris brassicae TaxID=7116 RepID=A0A9P0TWF5_PIEBR|nr:unnamed protein product [Pieris brassicae]